MRLFQHLGKPGVGELLESQFVFFASSALHLAFEYSAGCDRRNSHAISDEYDYVLRTIFIVPVS